ncbi:7-cyano-7-deazaguanine synthase [Marinobacter aromaticivorans]|uniref:7-cyano-7-deazaguanine synthase n=1 Tax=Marinobacter aromaticivorans TaxID=1494078 RepID=A0ABW2IX02_9GAMM|nr:7-cyano-7-deazaguanine synthase [Marinobacter aromaticivorans]
MRHTPATVHLLWTGGWDSTYRLLYLLREGKQVQPHYIIDPHRPSSRHELRAMEAISECINKETEKLSGTLLPTEISEKAASVRSNEIEEAYNAIIKKMYIGDQYMWLADYCETRGIEGMELGVENIPGNNVTKAVNLVEYPYSKIFGKFRFPILSTNKLEMKEWSEATGTLSIMELTWFCHKPTAGAEPCGRCGPCEAAIKEGMGYRFPLTSRIRYQLRIVPRLRSFAKKFPGFYYLLYSLKHSK